ncbi:hypothetical protein BDM02DRAFT_3123937 [Thelephora ganbajun]|uniref:Uncharacterized protein n=1 Tax=Thelephora ganbajun TaxID=370292 RepID=A0ACB6YZX8_THEGA|nr:hypothetical protein BDM02DRAFT_3123937 [Thelephora ganbajun]
MSYEHLRFGLEAELLLNPRDAPEFDDIKAFVKWILQGYQGFKRPLWPSMHVDLEGSYSSKNEKTGWSLSDDGSMHPDHDAQHQTKLISPILVDKVNGSHPTEVTELTNPYSESRYYAWNFINLYHMRPFTFARACEDLKKFVTNLGGLSRGA